MKWKKLLWWVGASNDASRAPLALTLILCAFLFFSTFSIAGTQTALTVGLVCWGVFALIGWAPRPHRTELDLPITLFIAAALLAAVHSERRFESLVNLKNLLLVSIVYLFAFTIRNGRDLRRLYQVLLFSGSASALFGIAVYAVGRGEGALGRTPGTFSTAMTFGGVLVIIASLFAAVALGSAYARRLRLLSSGAACASAAALFFSFTRSSWLGMFASLVVICIMIDRRYLAFLVLAAAVAMVLMPGPYRERVTSMWDPSFRTNVQRLEMLEGGWNIIKDHWLLGVGPQDLAEVYERYKPPGAVHTHGHMHNNVLQIAVTMGAVGLIAFCFLFVSFYRLIARNLSLPPPERVWAAGSLGALTGFVVNGFFEWNFGDAEVVMLLYFVIGSNLAMRSVTAECE